MSRTLLVLISVAAAALVTSLAGPGFADDAAKAEQSIVPSPQEWMKQIMELPDDNVRDALDDENRPATDRARDAVEKVEALLRASGIARDMRVLDLHTADGYLAQLLVPAVRRYGKVWAGNDPASLDAATAKAWTARLEAPSGADIALLDRPLDAEIARYATPVDIVFSVGAYHDATARGIDRPSMNKTVFAALSPGGKYVVVDARAGDGVAPDVSARVCRTSEALVRSEVEAAGFRFLRSSEALRDTTDSPAASACASSPDAKPGDRFLMVFEKPAPR